MLKRLSRFDLNIIYFYLILYIYINYFYFIFIIFQFKARLLLRYIRLNFNVIINSLRYYDLN